jgi:hypothetical protein
MSLVRIDFGGEAEAETGDRFGNGQAGLLESEVGTAGVGGADGFAVGGCYWREGVWRHLVR